MTIAVLDLSPAEPGVQPDARLVTDMLATALASKKAFRLVERKRLEELLGETEFGGAATATTVAGKIGAMTGAEAVVAGSIGRVGGELRIDARLVSVRDGTVLGAASARSGKGAEGLERAVERVAAALAAGVEGQAQAPVPAQMPGQAHAQAPFTITLLARGGSGELRSVKPGGSVRSGEHYKIVFTPDRDCYVYIFQVDASGRIDRLFPMASFGGVQVGQANPVRKGKRYVLPGQDLSFVLDRRAGMERLYCVVSDGPNENLESLYGRVASARREGARDREREDGERLEGRIVSRGLSAVTQDRPEAFAWESGGAPSSLVSNRLGAACPDCAHFIEFVHK